MDGLENEKEDNPLWKHCFLEHEGEKVEFKMKVVRGHKSPLTRQIQEGVEIECSTDDLVLNSKGEWNGSRLPRLRIEVGEKLENDDEDVVFSKDMGKIKEMRSWKIENVRKRRGGGAEKDKMSMEPSRKRRRLRTVIDTDQTATSYTQSDKDVKSGSQKWQGCDHCDQGV